MEMELEQETRQEQGTHIRVYQAYIHFLLRGIYWKYSWGTLTYILEYKALNNL